MQAAGNATQQAGNAQPAGSSALNAVPLSTQAFSTALKAVQLSSQQAAAPQAGKLPPATTPGRGGQRKGRRGDCCACRVVTPAAGQRCSKQ